MKYMKKKQINGQLEKKQINEQLEMKQILGDRERLADNLKSFRKAQAKLKQTYGRISVIRLVVFFIVITGLLIALAARQWWGWLLAGASVGGFVLLVLRHVEIGNLQDTLENLIQVYERYQTRLQGEWQTLPDTGVEFLEEQDYVSADLDVFGKASLYQMLCVAHTPAGRRRLAEVLRQHEEALETLRERQKAVAELAEKSQFAVRFEALAIGSEDKSRIESNETREPISKDTQKDEKEFPALLRLLSLIYPVCFLLSIIGAFRHWWSFGAVPVLFFAALLLSWLLTGYCQRKAGELLRHSRTVQTCLYMMDSLAVEAFETEYLKQLQKTIIGEENERDNLVKGLMKLERLLALYNVRYNPIVHWLLCGSCLYDFHLAAHAIAWKRQYGKALENGIAALGEVEMLSSLAVLERIHKVVYPSFEETALPAFHMEQVYHPLLKAETAIANDISMKQEPVIITGSNMSGKTTFLRTVGLNLILAYAGGPVCASALSTSRMRIFTSMRVVDDVRHGISTFYAEILRIKAMVEYGKQEQPMLCLIDEIFKGTNSADRIVGAEAVIRKLTGDHSITIVSTHDFELCKLAENYHFEEYYSEDRIHFDYKLKRGICTTTNALYLLKMAGLTE